MSDESSSRTIGKAVRTLTRALDAFRLENTSALAGLTFVVNGHPVGVIRPSEWALLQKHTNDVFERKQGEVHLTRWKTEPETTRGMAKVLNDLREKEVFPCLRGWRNELYDVAPSYGCPAVFRIERAATFIFGTKRYGIDVNGCIQDEHGRLKAVWLQRRSRSKELFPDLLDLYVSGGLATGQTPDECMEKECEEEASLSRKMCKQFVRPTGSAMYLYEDELGIHPEISFCYDANLPADLMPKPSDGEVEEFIQMPVDTENELRSFLEVIADPKKFKPTSVPIVVDLLIRRGLINGSFGADFFRMLEVIHQPLSRTYPPRQNR
ncbi:nudix hydrolase 20 [Tropilaelaps mercedesae]|uniref:Nudix hydrolase 20 n=1 Tax=Tropilaelaps mercedesae TaxID=418985 RepID=A0A1V9Y250_9ACAR|nr:nudix hydrolase 20 [Tropilaelaps mercedesae]